MNEGWIIFGLCVLTLLGATLPLLYERHSAKKNRPSSHPDKD